MALSAVPVDRRRPYAAAANVIGVLQRVRQRNLPDKIDNDFFRLAGVPEIVYGRVNEALRFIGVVGDDGRPTDLLRALHAAPDQEYRDALAGALREAYRDDFARIDPGEDTQAQIIDQFAPYQPKSQTARMVMLFLGLCREAGIPVLEMPRERKMKSAVQGRMRGRPTARRDEARGFEGRSHTPVQPLPPSSGLAGVTEADLVKLDEDTFNELWAALGKAFYKARTASSATVEVDDSTDESKAE